MAITLTPNIEVLRTIVDGEVTTRKIRMSASYSDPGIGVSISKSTIVIIASTDNRVAKLTAAGKIVGDLIKAVIPDPEQVAIVGYETNFQTYLDGRFTV